MKIAQCQCRDIKMGHQVTEAVELFDCTKHNFAQVNFHLGKIVNQSVVL